MRNPADPQRSGSLHYGTMRNGKPRPCAVRDYPDYLTISKIKHPSLGFPDGDKDAVKDFPQLSTSKIVRKAIRDFPVFPASKVIDTAAIRDFPVLSASKVLGDAEPVQDMLNGDQVAGTSSAETSSQKRDTCTVVERTDNEASDFDSSIHPQEIERGRIAYDAQGIDAMERHEIKQEGQKEVRDAMAIPKDIRGKDSSMAFSDNATRPEDSFFALQPDARLQRREQTEIEEIVKGGYKVQDSEQDKTEWEAIKESPLHFKDNGKQEDIGDLPCPDRVESEDRVQVSPTGPLLQNFEVSQGKYKAMELDVVEESEIEQMKKTRECVDFSIISKVRGGIDWLQGDEHVVAFQRVKKTQKKIANRDFPELDNLKSLIEKKKLAKGLEEEQRRSSSPGKELRATEVSSSKWKTGSGAQNGSKMVSQCRLVEMQLAGVGKEVKIKNKTGTYRQDVSKPAKRKSLTVIPSDSGKKVKLSTEERRGTDAVSARKAMVTSLRLFDSVRRKLLQDEETCKKHVKGTRIDLQVLSFKEHSHVHADKVVGSIPGLDVGDIFLFRSEIAFAKVHGPIQGGIEFLTKQCSKWDRPVAIGIISNVGQDGEDSGEELIYMGQGGKNADNKQIAHQKLERGNLAMDGNRELKLPVRVIRGIKNANSPSGKVYVYDGLYFVVQTFLRKGSGGFNEFQFKLQRLPGQSELGSKQFKLAAELKSQSPSSRMNIVVEDLSRGKENQPICVENSADDKVPPEFEYVTKVRYPDGMPKLGPPGMRCNCEDHCVSGKCSCVSRNGDELPYLNGRCLVREKDYIFECGSQCPCFTSCLRKPSENRQMFRLEVFRTADRGWGVRSLEMMPAGSFVCEYTGKMIFGEEMIKTVINKEHVLDLRRLPVNRPYWGDMPSIFPNRSSANVMPDMGNPELIIDATKSGNVARFINHSCSPNLLAQKVVSEQDDLRFPRIMLFAMDNIPPMKELTFDYGEPLENEDHIMCVCGSFNCRGRL